MALAAQGGRAADLRPQVSLMKIGGFSVQHAATDRPSSTHH